MTSQDISSDLSYIIQLIFNAYQFCFSFLSSIKLFGTDLLRLSIAFFILNGVFGLIFTVLHSTTVYTLSSDISRRRRSRRGKDKGASSSQLSSGDK